MNKAALSIPVLDTEDREKRYEEAILLDGSVIKIYAPYIDAAYFDSGVYCLEYDNKCFIYQDTWREQKELILRNKLIRKVGKYLIKTTRDEITEDNFFKFSVNINGEYISTSELSLYYSKVFRYSENEKEIKFVLESIVKSREDSIQKLRSII